MNTEHIVNATFNAFLFTQPNSSEAAYYQNELANALITPTNLGMQGAQLDDFQQLYLPFAGLYKAAFGNYITKQEMLVWGDMLRNGLTLEQAADQFISSEHFQAQVAAAGDTPTLLKNLVANSAGITLADADALYYADQLDQGQITPTEVLFKITELIDSLDTGLALLHTALTGDSGTYVPPATTDVREAINQVYNRYLTSDDSEPVSGIYEENGTLYIASDAEASPVINLAEDRITDSNNDPIPLDLGQISDVVYIDARSSSQSIDVTGSSNHEIIYGSDNGDTLRPGAGNDNLLLQENDITDTLIFEADATTTGYNSITHFTVGDGGDVLDFSRFLNNAYDAEPVVQAIDITQTAPSPALSWTNTDILVLLVEGDASTLGAQNIADFFVGSGSPAPWLEQPTASGKNVVITAGVEGDAKIWYLTNAETPSVIEANEITAVGTLVNVNNLSLTSLPAENFL